MKKVMLAIAVLSLLGCRTAKAQVASYQRAESISCACTNMQTVQAVSSGLPQTQCDIWPLSINVNLLQPSLVRICYDIFGNARILDHDGVNAWVTGPPTQPIVASGELVPLAILPGGFSFGGASVAACETINAGESFTATVRTAYFHHPDWTNLPEEDWGCRSRKMGQNSWLTAEVLQ
jgi:hypothetical protein